MSEWSYVNEYREKKSSYEKSLHSFLKHKVIKVLECEKNSEFWLTAGSCQRRQCKIFKPDKIGQPSSHQIAKR